ncbi:MAG TPA: response regulator transcription factor [Candidatus Eremiobacteraceae bacterium]|nr:response regulator transcription factor [Candidatus Eremiobacteraceae bacterium]
MAICDDHPVVREGLASVLGRRPDLKIVASVGTVGDLLAAARTSAPDVVLLDLELPDGSGLVALDRLAPIAPQTRVVMFTVHESDDTVRAALNAGAMGYVRKGAPADEIAAAIRDVHAGRMHVQPHVAAWLVAGRRGRADLSPRQRDVLRLIADGRSNKQIAESLSITERTVKFHVTSIMNKLGVDNRAQAAAAATKKQLL